MVVIVFIRRPADKPVPRSILGADLPGLASDFGAGLLSPLEAGLPSPPAGLDAEDSFLAASLYFSLR